jgi:7-carboxy-7-deazaguanine synthase
VFCRFSGCNLWSGREPDRTDAVCKFCDTDFVGWRRYESPEQLATAITWHNCRFVVLTGGEPALQVDAALLSALHDEGCEVAIETNGTLPLPDGIDWICVSPKAGTTLQTNCGDELKIVYPQLGLDPRSLEHLEFTHRFIQPMAGYSGSTEAAVEFCKAHPRWRLSLQTHKYIGIP